MVLFGGCPSGTRVSFDTGRLHYDQITLMSPFHFTPRDVSKAQRLLTEGRIDGRPLITGTYSFPELQEVLALLQQGQALFPHRTVTLEQLRLLKPPAILAIPRERRE